MVSHVVCPALHVTGAKRVSDKLIHHGSCGRGDRRVGNIRQHVRHPSAWLDNNITLVLRNSEENEGLFNKQTSWNLLTSHVPPACPRSRHPAVESARVYLPSVNFKPVSSNTPPKVAAIQSEHPPSLVWRSRDSHLLQWLLHSLAPRSTCSGSIWDCSCIPCFLCVF
jgi:hypothetical protein